MTASDSTGANAPIVEIAPPGGELARCTVARRWRARSGNDGEAWMGFDQRRNMPDGTFMLVFDLSADVWPDGIGGLLFRRVLDELAAHSPEAVLSYLQDSHRQMIELVESHGCAAEMRERRYSLDMATFDLERYADLDEHLASQGIGIASLAELGATDEVLHGVWQLECEIHPDLPGAGDSSGPTYDDFRALIGRPAVLHEAYLVAIHDGEYVGLTSVERSDEETVESGHTAIVRGWRRRSIARALKVRNIRWCAENGIRSMETEIVTTNHSMIGLIDELGFQPGETWIWYRSTG